MAFTEEFPPEAPFAERSDEQLADEIATWAWRVAAGEARLLALVGEFDRREAWGQPGMLSCAHWLSWRLGMGRAAAHERVRVARALLTLPSTAAAFGAGRVSWTQVRAITRVATADDEGTYLECARHCTGAQLEALTRGVRRARRAEEDAADPEQAAWRMRARTSYDPDGTMVLTVRMPAEHGAVLLAAVEEAMADLDRERRAGGSSAEDSTPPSAPSGKCATSSAEDSTPSAACPPPRATMAEGLLRLAEDSLERLRQDRPEAGRRGRARPVAQVDPLSGCPTGSCSPTAPSAPRHGPCPAAVGCGRWPPLTSPSTTSAGPGAPPPSRSESYSPRWTDTAAGSPAAPAGAASTPTTYSPGPTAATPTSRTSSIASTPADYRTCPA